MGRGSLRRGAVVLSTMLLAGSLQLAATQAPAAAAVTIHVPGDEPTIAAAIAAASDGDTVVVAAGTYTEYLNFAGKDVHLESISGPAVTKIRPIQDGDKITLGPGGSIEGFTIAEGVGVGSAALEVIGAGSVVRGNRFERNPEGNGRTALLVFGSSAVIDGNWFSANSCSATGRVLSVEGDSSPTIVNNLFYENQCTAIDVNTTAGSALITNNTIVTGTRGLRVAGTPAGFHHEIRNNIITDQDVAAFAYSPTNVLFPTVENNLVFGNAADFVGFEVDPVGAAGNVRADPVFVNAAGRDLRLDATSAAVDAASATDAPATDHDGSARPLDGPDVDGDAEFDIGAFERDGTEPAAVAQTGVIDPGWSTDGIHDISSPYFVSMVHAGSDRLFTASFKESESATQFRMRKLEANATPSPGFGTNGTLLRNFGTGGLSFPVLLEPAGTGLLAVGEYYGSTSRLGVAKLRADGTYDPAFSGDGRALYKVFSSEHDVVSASDARVLANGKIVLVAMAQDYDSADNLVLTGRSVLRLNANGTADTSYSGDARVPLTTAYSDVAVLASGSIYAGRKSGSLHEVRKFNSSGGLDRGFSGDGIVSVSCGTHIDAGIAADSANRPVLVCVRPATVAGVGTVNLGFFRFTLAGAPDSTYSGDGKTALVLTGGTDDSWTGDFDDTGLPWIAIRDAHSPNRVLVFTLTDTGVPNTAWSGDGKAGVRLPSTVDLGDVERSASRLYIEDFPDESNVRITAVKG